MISVNENFSGPRKGLPELLEKTSRIFSADGDLVSTLGLEYRPQQARMAEHVIDSMMGDHPLLFEAGTGVGKSLAYLLPGIIRAVDSDRPLIVSSHTISLQEQLEKKDIPLCRRFLSAVKDLEKFADFKHAMLVGRGNYLCGTRLAQALESRSELFDTPGQRDLERIRKWAAKTSDGLLMELNPPPIPEVWDWVNADGPACNNRNCTARNCHYRRAMTALREARVIIVNHSLLMALLGSGRAPGGKTSGVLFPKDFVVVDEAHILPSIAAEHFGHRISSFGLRRLLQRLYHPRRRNPGGLLLRWGTQDLCSRVVGAMNLAEQFFGELLQRYLRQNSTVRMNSPGWAEHLLDGPLEELTAEIRKVESRLEEGPARDELSGAREALGAYRNGIDECIGISDPDSVYWLERTGRSESIVHLRSAPIDVAPHLRRHLFERGTSVVLTSATLADGPDMESFQRKVGAQGYPAMIEASPFAYADQVEILLAKDSPEPDRANPESFRNALAENLRLLLPMSQGGSLVLFTSYHEMHALEQKLRRLIEESMGRLMWCQGIDGSRTYIVDALRANGRGVIFGTDSFWTGVDVPGPALSQVIITRLPFQNPSHPIAEARHEHCRETGGNPFRDITLPEALIQFRQGWGRLIRHSTDSGQLVVLDSRILKRRYGRAFIDVLPHSNWKVLGR